MATMSREVEVDKEMSLNSDAVVADNKTEDKSQDKTPDQLFNEIVNLICQPNTKFQFAVVECSTICIGTYGKFSSTDGFPVVFSELGIAFYFPHSNEPDTMVDVCVPLNTISDILVQWKTERPLLFISVNPQIAKWVREVLDMDGDPEDGTGNYFCPDSEYQKQKMILLELTSESGGCKVEISKIQRIYEDKLNVISISASTTMLMSMLPPELLGGDVD